MILYAQRCITRITQMKEVILMGRFDNFEIIRTSSNKPSASITKSGIAFNKLAVETLGAIPYVQPLIDKQSKQFVIIECEERTDGSKEFFTGKQEISYGVRWNSRDMKSLFETVMGWDLSSEGFQVDGEYIPEERALLFDLTKARPAPIRQRKD